MLNLIIETAKTDDRIRAAYLEGSRVNPYVPKDIFQDYDVVYVVNETETFRRDRGWIDRFGPRLYMQYPEDGVYSCSDRKRCYGWLMQFTDGNRLDLHVCTLDYAREHLELYCTLLDKDNVLPIPQAPEDAIQRYWVKKPTPEEFLCTCNEFWWCLNNVAKGLWREELPYVLDMIDFNVRPMLKRLLEWKIGMEYHFLVSAGKSGKYMKQYLPEESYRYFLDTYPAAETEAIWDAVFTMCDLFAQTAGELTKTLNLPYDLEEADNSRRYLEDIRRLPPDAAEIY